MDIVILISELLIAVFFFAILYYFLRMKSVKGYYVDFRKKQIEDVYKNPSKRISYDEMQRFLLSRGANYNINLFKGELGPFEYMVMRVVFALVGVIIGLLLNPIAALPAGVFGYFLVKLWLDYANKCDNSDMLVYLPEIYYTISLLSNNGVYLANAVYECYMNTKMTRLKQALLELSKEIRVAENIELAAEHFRQKFDNPYIDTFAKTIEQSLVSGDAGQVFSDVSKQLDSINAALYLKEEARVNRRIFISTTIAFLVGIIGLAYVMVMGLSDSAGGFF